MSVSGEGIAVGLAIGLLLSVVGVGIYSLVVVRHRKVAPSMPEKRTEAGSLKCGGDVWVDPEKGDVSGRGSDAPAAMSPKQLEAALKQLLSGDLAECYRTAEFMEQLERLERKVASSLETRTPNSSDRSGSERICATPQLWHFEDGASQDLLPGAMGSMPRPPLPIDAPPLPPDVEISAPPTAPILDVDLPAEPAPPLEFGPTERQSDAMEVEARRRTVDPEASEKTSLQTVQRILGRRDAQITELQRQLREARQHLWLQTAEAKGAKERLYDVISDPQRAPQAQAQALDRLRSDVRDLSGRLADAKAQEKHWCSIAKRQRQFFLQTEHMERNGHEGHLLKHPAGEVFIAPPPVTRPYEDEDGEEEGPGWNVGASHCNPYKVDSWPFEPNVLAQRMSHQSNLEDCIEGDDGAEEIQDDDSVEAASEDPQRHRRDFGFSDDDDGAEPFDEAASPSAERGAAMEYSLSGHLTEII